MTDYPDFTVIARLKGEYDGLEKAVALDSEGALQALLYGTYGGANKKLAVDTDGNAQMNLYAQDLEEVINRFKYGAPIFDFSMTAMPAQYENVIYDITGKGYVYYLDIWVEGWVSHYLDYVRVFLDGEAFRVHNYNQLNIYNAYRDDIKMIHLIQYDNVAFKYRVKGIEGYTFESSVEIRYSNNPAAPFPPIHREFVYTLI